MTEIGICNERRICYQRYDNQGVWSKDIPKESWLLFVIADGKGVAEFNEISTKILDNEACYACCAGEQSELLHDHIDNEIVLREIQRGHPPSIDTVTTWDFVIEEGLWFSIYAAHSEQVIIKKIICLDAGSNDHKLIIEDLIERFNQGYLPPD